MSIIKFSKAVACLLVLLLIISLSCLPAFALPAMGPAASDPAQNGRQMPFEGENSDGMGGKSQNNLGDTDGDGHIEPDPSDTGLADDLMRNARDGSRDPAEVIDDGVEQVTDDTSSSWITAVICIVAVIALILIIVALIPKKRIK